MISAVIASDDYPGCGARECVIHPPRVWQEADGRDCRCSADALREYTRALLAEHARWEAAINGARQWIGQTRHGDKRNRRPSHAWADVDRAVKCLDGADAETPDESEQCDRREYEMIARHEEETHAGE